MADFRVKSIDDVRAWIGPAADGRSDEDVLSAFSQATGHSPSTVAGALGYDTGGAGPWREKASSSVDSYQSNLYGVGEAVSGALGLKGPQDWMAGRRRANEFSSNVSSERAQAGGIKSSYKDVDWSSPADVGRYVGGLAVDSAPYMAEAAVGGAAGRMIIGGAGTAARTAASVGGAMVASYPSALGDVLANQREQNGQTDLGSAAALAVPYTLLNEGFGVEGRIARGRLARNTNKLLDSTDGVRGGVTRAAFTGLKTATSEGLSETGQEVLNQAGRVAVDPTASMTSSDALGRYGESFVGGAVLGGAFGAAGGGWRRSEHYEAPKPGVDTPAGANLLSAPELQLQMYGQEDGPYAGPQTQDYQVAPAQPQAGQYDMFNPNGTPTYGADNWGGDSLTKPADVMSAQRTGLRGPAQAAPEENTQPMILPHDVQGQMYRIVADKADAGQPLTPTEQHILDTYSSKPVAPAGPAPQLFVPQTVSRPGFQLDGNPTPQFDAQRPVERPDFELAPQDTSQMSLDLQPQEQAAPVQQQPRPNQKGFTNELPFVPPEAKINTPAGRQLFGLADSLRSEGYVDEATMDQVTTLLTTSKLAQASKIINQALADKKAAKATMEKAQQHADQEAAKQAEATQLANNVSTKSVEQTAKPTKISPVAPEVAASKVDKYERLIACLKG